MEYRAYGGSLYDLDGVEQWLSDLSAQGLELLEFTRFGKLARLQETKPLRRRYHAEVGPYRDDETRQAYGEQGWSYVCSTEDVLIYVTTEPWAHKPKRRNQDEKALRKKWLTLWADLLLWVVGLGLAGWQAIHGMITAGLGSYYDFLTGMYWVLIPGVLLVLAEIWAGVTKTYDLLIWRKCIRRQEEAEVRQGMKAFRWSEYVALPVILGSCILLLLSVLIRNTSSRTYVPIWRQDRELPLVTLDVTEEEIFYAPQPMGPSINVSYKRRPLIPQDIHIESYGFYEDLGSEEAWRQMNLTSGSDARLRFAYYRLWTEDMAVRLAESRAEELEILLEEAGDFEELWFNANQHGWEHLVAREGDVVVTAVYYGESTLKDHIPEIYEIVTEYRNR